MKIAYGSVSVLRLYSSLEREEEADRSAIASSIDAQLVQHLQAAMVLFVTDIMHRTILWREREVRLKQRNRAWRQGDQVCLRLHEKLLVYILTGSY